jgi:hypothetical protein
VRGYFPREEYEDRWRRLAAEMRSEGYAAALIWSRSAGGYRSSPTCSTSRTTTRTNPGQADEDAWIGVGFAAVIFVPDETPELVAGPSETSYGCTHPRRPHLRDRQPTHGHLTGMSAPGVSTASPPSAAVPSDSPAASRPSPEGNVSQACDATAATTHHRSLIL